MFKNEELEFKSWKISKANEILSSSVIKQDNHLKLCQATWTTAIVAVKYSTKY